MKTEFNITLRAARNSLGVVVCAGAVLLLVSTAQAQNLFVSRGTSIYEFTPGGAYSTFATESGNALGLAFDRAGDLFVPNTGNGTIIAIAPNGTQRTFASGLQTPSALAFDSAGDLFVSDIGKSTIYEFTPARSEEHFCHGIVCPLWTGF